MAHHRFFFGMDLGDDDGDQSVWRLRNGSTVRFQSAQPIQSDPAVPDQGAPLSPQRGTGDPQRPFLTIPVMERGETVAQYLHRRRTGSREVRLVDGCGYSRIVSVPHEQQQWTVGDHTFTFDPLVRFFDDELRPCWFTTAVLQLPPQCWPNYRRAARLQADEHDRKMHRELDQWAEAGPQSEESDGEAEA